MNMNAISPNASLRGQRSTPYHPTLLKGFSPDNAAAAAGSEALSAFRGLSMGADFV